MSLASEYNLTTISTIITNSTSHGTDTQHTNTHTHCHQYHYEQFFFGLPEAMIWAIISITCIVVNIHIIRGILKNKSSYRSNHHIYLCSLLSANVLMGLVVHPSIAYTATGHHLSCTLHTIFTTVSVFAIYVSLLSTLAIAINRYVSLNARTAHAFNFMQKRKTKKKHLVIGSIVWTASFIRCIPVIARPHDHTPPVLIPILIITIGTIYSLLTKKLGRFAKRARGDGNRSGSLLYRKYKNSIRFIKVLMCLLMAFWFPFVTYKVVSLLSGWRNVILSTVLIKAFWLVPVLEPFCYQWFQAPKRTRPAQPVAVAAIQMSVIYASAKMSQSEVKQERTELKGV